MVLYPTTLGDEITFLFCFLPAPEKAKLWWAKALHLSQKTKFKLLI